jgi:hypothetical protein
VAEEEGHQEAAAVEGHQKVVEEEDLRLYPKQKAAQETQRTDHQQRQRLAAGKEVATCGHR